MSFGKEYTDVVPFLSFKAELVGIKYGQLPLAGRLLAHSESHTQQQGLGQLLLWQTGLRQIL